MNYPELSKRLYLNPFANIDRFNADTNPYLKTMGSIERAREIAKKHEKDKQKESK